MHGMRKFERYDWFGIIFNMDDAPNRPIGFSVNISENGICLWINHLLVQTYDLFTIKLLPPSETDFNEPILLGVDLIWKEDTRTENYLKIGCRFPKLLGEQEDHLDRIITFLKQDKQFARV